MIIHMQLKDHHEIKTYIKLVQEMASETLDRFEPWSRLEGKVVFVTGASSGLGLEFCLDLAKAGCKVVAAARRIERLKTLCEQINKMYVVPTDGANSDCKRAFAVELDVAGNGKAIEESVQQAWDAFGHIDALVNNAGVRGPARSSLELSEAEWDQVVKTNLKGTWLVSKCVGTRLRSAGRGGSIINISSISALNRGQQRRGAAAYSSSKAGLDALTKIMALELGEYRIRVNSIAPALFKSEITEGLYRKKILENVAKKGVPLGTFGATDPALTSLVRYLVHDASGYVTGNIFIVDSGYTLPGTPIFSSL